MRTALKVGIGVAVLVIIILASLYSMYISGYNGVQAKDESVKKRAADVDTQLQRRYDLIPNLVSSVKGYMQFERQTLEDITELRSQWMKTPDTAQRVNLSNQLEATLSKIIATYEAYPELKSDSTVTRLMDELAGTENRISVSRTVYNDGVEIIIFIFEHFQIMCLMIMAFLEQKLGGINSILSMKPRF